MGIFHSTCCDGASETALTVTRENASGAEISDICAAAASSEQLESADPQACQLRSSVSLELGFYVDDAGALTEDYGGCKGSEDPDTTEMLAKRKESRKLTWELLNQKKQDEEAARESTDKALTKNMELVHLAVERVSRRSQMVLQEPEKLEGADAQAELEEHVREMLEQIAQFVDQDYDILPAEMLLSELENLIGPERFVREVLTSDLFERFARKLDFFYDVGNACSESQSDWMEVYANPDRTQVITGLIDKQDASVLHYNVLVEIPASITHVMAVANEVKLMPKWNSLIVSEPEVIGRRTAHYMVLNYQMSAVGGMYRVDALNEIRRFSDQEGGFMVEYCTSVAPDHPSFRDSKKGYKRMQTLLKNVFIACGPDHTVLIQRGRLKLPFAVNNWVAKTIGGLAGKFIVGGLVSNSIQASVPKNQWQDLVQEDEFGLYHRLDQLTNCEASQRRNPKNSKDGKKVANYDVDGFFNKRRFHRASSRQVMRATTLAR